MIALCHFWVRCYHLSIGGKREVRNLRSPTATLQLHAKLDREEKLSRVKMRATIMKIWSHRVKNFPINYRKTFHTQAKISGNFSMTCCEKKHNKELKTDLSEEWLSEKHLKLFFCSNSACRFRLFQKVGVAQTRRVINYLRNSEYSLNNPPAHQWSALKWARI